MDNYYLTPRHIRLVKQYRPAYEDAVAAVGTIQGTLPPQPFPWEAIATLHFLEADFLERVKVPGGPFQLDPGLKGEAQEEAIRVKVAEICGKYGWPIGDIATDFTTAVRVATAFLKMKVGFHPLFEEDMDRDILPDAFWGYNGRSKWHTPTAEAGVGKASWEYSPYVNNDPKAGRCLMVRASIPDATVEGGRRKISRPELHRPGAMIVYRELKARHAEVG